MHNFSQSIVTERRREMSGTWNFRALRMRPRLLVLSHDWCITRPKLSRAVVHRWLAVMTSKLRRPSLFGYDGGLGPVADRFYSTRVSQITRTRSPTAAHHNRRSLISPAAYHILPQPFTHSLPGDNCGRNNSDYMFYYKMVRNFFKGYY